MEDLLNEGLLLFGNTLLAVLAIGAGWMTKWIASKVKNEKVAAVIMRTDDLAIKVVRDVYQTYVSELKAGKADGKLTRDEKSTAKGRAFSQLKSYLGTKGLKEVGWLLGGEDVDRFLSTVIENAVTASKNTGVAARGTAAVNPT